MKRTPPATQILTRIHAVFANTPVIRNGNINSELQGKNPHKKLHRAIESHRCRTILQLLDDGVKPCTTNRSTNCFFLAQEHTGRGGRLILKKLLEIEPSGVNCQDSKGLTLLMRCYDMETFELLLKYKPNVNLLNDEGENVLFYILRKHFVTYPWQWKRLFELGLDVNLVNKGETVLVIAIQQCFVPLVLEEFFQAGATLPPLALDKYGENVVTEAMKDERMKITNKIEYLETFIKNGVDVSAKDNKGRNAMYYIIQEHFRALHDSDDDSTDMNWLSKLEETLIILLQHNCEAQGLEETFEIVKHVGVLRYYIEKLDIISTFARYGPSVKFLKQLVDRGLYSWTKHREFFKGTTEPMSPLTAYLCNVCNFRSKEPDFAEILDMCEYFISIGVDPTHRSQGQNFRFKISKHWKKLHGTDILQVSNNLIHPDALFFVAILAAQDDCEYLLRLFLRFWPYPPLCMILIGVQYTRSEDSKKLVMYPDNLTFYNLLIKIGGAVPLKSRFYKSIKMVLQQVTEIDENCQSVLDSFLQLDDSTSSSDSDCSSVESCICGSTISDSSDWNDKSSEEECKRARIETSKVKNTHDQLHRAIEKHDCRTIRQLLENGVKPCTTPISCFILARRSGFILKKLLEIEPSGVNCRDPRGYTMLMLCDDYRNRSGIPTLRSLSRAAFRATVKKTCPTGLDFSEYRVLCQGEMVALPPDIVNFLEFRV
ncbi:hypothetical protein B566_EDAN010033 [Ephemera danica]|nr:hypothetical protein B566_EDAN010033 [Ephemera danica]